MPIHVMCIIYATQIMQLRHRLCEHQRRLLPKDASFGFARTMGTGLGVGALPGRMQTESSAFASLGGEAEDAAEESEDDGPSEEDAEDASLRDR